VVAAELLGAGGRGVRTLRDLLDETGGSILESQGRRSLVLRWTSDNAVLDQSFRQSVRFEVVWPTVD